MRRRDARRAEPSPAEATLEWPDELIVDLSQTTFVDSLTLGSLTAAAKRLRTNGGRFRVVGATAPEVRRALQITGLDGYLKANGEGEGRSLGAAEIGRIRSEK